MRSLWTDGVVALALVVGCGCGTTPRTQGTMPAYPTDAELANEGAEPSIKALEEKFLVSQDPERGELLIGDSTIRPTRSKGFLESMQPEMQLYIGGDAAAGALLPKPIWSYLLLVSTGLLFLSIPLLLLGILPGIACLAAAVVVQGIGEWGLQRDIDTSIAQFNANMKRRIRAQTAAGAVPPAPQSAAPTSPAAPQPAQAPPAQPAQGLPAPPAQ